MLQNTGSQLVGPVAPNSTELVSLVALASAETPLGATEAFPVNITAGDVTLDVPFSLFIGNSSVNSSLSVLTVDQCAPVPLMQPSALHKALCLLSHAATAPPTAAQPHGMLCYVQLRNMR